jgi:hypothetical protein
MATCAIPALDFSDDLMNAGDESRFPQLSFDDLCPVAPDGERHLLMIFKGYFDGARDANSKRITVAMVCGESEHWDGFTANWKSILAIHRAPFLHMTDAMALRGEFAKEKGWDKPLVDALISDCVRLISEYMDSLNVVTMDIYREDFLRARKTVPSLPNTMSELCATESLGFCFKYGKDKNADWYQLYYDQGEPFFGHICDRKNHRKARRHIPNLSKVAVLAEANMRLFPPLQMADLFAWAISHNHRVSREWHRCLNDLDWKSLCLRYENLVRPIEGAAELIESWNLPRRKAD